MCLDKPKFGGEGKWKQKCELRKCKILQKRVQPSHSEYSQFYISPIKFLLLGSHPKQCGTSSISTDVLFPSLVWFIVCTCMYQY